MKCPVCAEVDLLMSERQGVEIDYCPKCRGVWLDRGELDKIIEKAAGEPEPARPERSGERERESGRERGREEYRHEGHGRDHDDDRGYGHGKPHKRKSLLGEIFDF
ncbi:MAG: zf-TFIIB domain-containing protein [Nitrospirae bacterium]|nr:zf-TFIIB domain-containing protein [Nitrospirota bacterium]MBI5695229.1 zf-TFIIB domain-containing protein [Nitrospirota bacterium]